MSNIYAVLLAVIPALLNLSLLIYLLFFLPRGKITSLFALFIIAIILWQVEDIVARLTLSEEVMQSWDRMLAIGWLGMAPILLHFVVRFTSWKKKVNSFFHFLIYMPFIIFHSLYIGNPSPVRFTYNNFWGWINTPRPGTLDLFQRHYASVIVIISLILLFRYVHKHRANKEKKIQGLLIAVGVFIPAIQGMITQVLFPLFLEKAVPVTSAFMTFLSLAIIIALSRYRLFNVSESLEVEGVLANINTIVLVVSPDKKIVYANPYAVNKFGSSIKKGKIGIRDVFKDGADFLKFEKLILKDAMEEKPVTEFESQFLYNGESTADIIIYCDPIKNNNTFQGFLVIAHDVTERKNHLKAIREQDMRMEEIAYTQSHIIRSPLSRILGLVDIIKYPQLNEDERKEILGYIAESANNLDDVIREIVKKTGR